MTGTYAPIIKRPTLAQSCVPAIGRREAKENMNKLGSGAHDIVYRKSDGLDKDSGAHMVAPWP